MVRVAQEGPGRRGDQWVKRTFRVDVHRGPRGLAWLAFKCSRPFGLTNCVPPVIQALFSKPNLARSCLLCLRPCYGFPALLGKTLPSPHCPYGEPCRSAPGPGCGLSDCERFSLTPPPTVPYVKSISESVWESRCKGKTMSLKDENTRSDLYTLVRARIIKKDTKSTDQKRKDF